MKIKISPSNHAKEIIKRFVRQTPFRPIHMGPYLRAKYFFKHLQALPIMSFHEVLDAGCGSGEYDKKLAVICPHLKITGYDIKEYATWNDSFENVRFKRQDLKCLSEENYYDLCLCIDVLEHIPGNYKVLENIFRSLKPGGYFYLHMPSRAQQRIFPEKFFKEFEDWAKDEHIGEMYTLEEMEQILRPIGFSIIKAHYTFGFWGKLSWELDRITDKMILFRILFMPFLKLLAFFDLWFPKNNGNGVCVLAQKNLS